MAATSNPTMSILIAWGGNVISPLIIGTSLIGTGQLTGIYAVDFSGAYDDVTLDCEEFDVDRGRDDPLSTMQAGKCSLTLFDLDGRYNPLNAASPIFGQMIPLRQVKIEATTSDSVVYPLFRGFIRSVDYDPRTYRARIVAEDLFMILSRVKPVIGV